MKALRLVCMPLLAVTMLLAVSACSTSGGRESGTGATPAAESAVPVPAPEKTLPDLIGRSLTDVASLLRTIDASVSIEVPAASASYAVAAATEGGKTTPAHTAHTSVPARVVPLTAAVPSSDATPNRTVTGQTPAAGTPLSAVTTLRLKVGPHQWATRTPWLVGHANFVRANGLPRCLPCHDPATCASCHVRIEKPSQ